MAETPTGARARLKAWTWFAVKAAISVALLAAMLAQVSFDAALQAVARLSPASFAAAAAIVVVAHVVNARRLAVFLPELGLSRALRFTFIGTFYSTVLPSQLAGDAIKAVRLARVHDDAGRAVSAVVRDKIMGLAALIALSLAAAVVSEIPGRTATIGLLAAALAVTAGLWLALDSLPRTGRWIWVAKLLPRAGDAGLTPRQLFENFMWGVLFQALVVAIFAVVGIDLGLDISAGAWIAVVGVVSVILLLPVTVAGVGLREGSLVSLMGALGQDAAATLAMSLVILILSLGAAGIGFAIDMLSRDRMD